jgi:TorA maturation chaperone TorD
MTKSETTSESKVSQSSVRIQPASVALDHGQSDEDLARADLYGLLAELFGAPPPDALFNRIAASPKANADDPDTPLTRAWRDLVGASASLAPVAIRAEYSALFEAVGKPEVVPNGSFYLAGALNQRPLVELREALAQFGIERDPQATETEDHIAAVCEVMRFLVAGELTDEGGAPIDLLAAQRQFFQGHLGNWVFDFLQALEQHRHAAFYAAVAQFARAFFEVEQQAFDIYSAGIESA